MRFVRRRLCALVGSVIAGTIGSSLACAQTDNVTPLRFVVPCAVGSPADTVARAFAEILTKNLGRNVYVDKSGHCYLTRESRPRGQVLNRPLRCNIRVRMRIWFAKIWSQPQLPDVAPLFRRTPSNVWSSLT